MSIDTVQSNLFLCSDLKISRISEILSNEALEFIYTLESKFGKRRKELLDKRIITQKEIDNGKAILNQISKSIV